MRRLLVLLQNIIRLPKRFFSKVSVLALLSDSEVDDTAAICAGARFYRSKLGRYSYVGRTTFITNTTIGNFCSIAGNCNIGGTGHPLNWVSTSSVFHKWENILKKNFARHEYDIFQQTTIGNDVWIATNAMIRAGVTIGDGAVIGMGAIVTKDVGPYEIWAGNPARQIRKRFDEETIRRLSETKWWDWPDEKISAYAPLTKDVGAFLDKALAEKRNGRRGLSAENRGKESGIEKEIGAGENAEKKRLLILSIFPAPYRVAVFRELAKHYEIDLFFEVVQNQDRNADWFVESGAFMVLNTPENKRAYGQCLKNIKTYDMVLAYDYFSKRANVLMLRCMAAGVPYAINCDGAFINDRPLKKAVKRLFVSHAALCFASGSFAGNYFLHYGAKKERIFYHHFTSLSETDYLEKPLGREEKATLRDASGIGDRPTVLAVGQFIPRKGFDILLRAWEQVETDANLVIVGGGGEKQTYLDYIKAHRLRNVTILEFMEKERLVRMYRQADLFVLPTREDVWGLVVNEAMANGLPVIATDRCIAGMELIRPGKSGYVVPAENPRRLAMAMNRLLSNPEKLRQMGENSLTAIKGKSMRDIAAGHIRAIDGYLSGERKFFENRRDGLSASAGEERPAQVPVRDFSGSEASSPMDEKGSSRVYIVTSVHNRYEITKKYLSVLKRQTYQNLFLVLVDDGCTDGTAEMVKQEFPRSVILRGDGNLWWAGGLQKAYQWLKKHVKDMDAPVLINNDDVDYGEDYIETGVRLLKEHPGTMVAGSGYGAGSKKQLDGIFYHDFKDGTGSLLPPGRESNAASTRSLFLTMGDWRKTGGMHPVLLPHYMSDFEFTIRAYRKGIRLRSFPELTYTFDEKATGESEYEKLTLKKVFSRRSNYNPFYRISFVLLSTPPRFLPAHLLHQLGRFAGKLGIFKRLAAEKLRGGK